MLIVLATPLALLSMATDIFPEINIPVISIIWNYNERLAAQLQGQQLLTSVFLIKALGRDWLGSGKLATGSAQ